MSIRCPRITPRATRRPRLAVTRGHGSRRLIRLAALGTVLAATSSAVPGCAAGYTRPDATGLPLGTTAQASDPQPLLLKTADLPGYDGEEPPEITRPDSDHPRCVNAMNQIKMKPSTTAGALRASSFFRASRTGFWLEEAINSYRSEADASADLERFETSLDNCKRYKVEYPEVPFPFVEKVTRTDVGLISPGFAMHIEVSAPDHEDAPPTEETLVVLQQDTMLIVLSHGGAVAPPKEETRQIATLALKRALNG